MSKKTWNCYGVVKGSKHLGKVEAETKEEAEDLAMKLDAAQVSLCHQCADECEDPQVDDVVVEEVDQ